MPDVTRTPARVLLILAFVLLPAVASAQQGDAQAGDVRQQGRPEPARRALSDGLRIWWNQPRFVEGLQLTEEQRGRMDAVLQSHLETRKAVGLSYQQARGAMIQAAQAGDWTAAEAANARLGEASAELARLEGALVVSVLKLMNAEQRAKLKEFPMVLRRPWLLGGAGMAGRGGVRRPPG